MVGQSVLQGEPPESLVEEQSEQGSKHEEGDVAGCIPDHAICHDHDAKDDKLVACVCQKFEESWIRDVEAHEGTLLDDGLKQPDEE